MERKTEEDEVMRTWKIDVGGYRKTGRLKLRLCDVIRKGKNEKGVKKGEAQERIT